MSDHDTVTSAYHKSDCTLSGASEPPRAPQLEAEIARLRAIPRNAWGMPLSNRSSLLCAIM